MIIVICNNQTLIDRISEGLAKLS